MASKVLVPAAPFAKLQVKSPPESPPGFVIGGDAAARVAHLEHSVRFLQEQHRLMLSGLHAEIEALRERNRDLQFQLIFNKESSPKPGNTDSTQANAEENTESAEEVSLRNEVSRLEKEAAAARGEARAADARALQMQRIVEAQAEKIREAEVRCASTAAAAAAAAAASAAEAAEAESRAELRARLADAERLVRRLRGDAERQRREVLAGGVTNLLFDPPAATRAHLQCMKNSLHASLRASGLDSFGYQNHYAFPPVHTPEFWHEPLREEFSMGGSRVRSNRRPITLPELSAVGQPIHRSTVYANPHARPRYDKPKKTTPNGEASNGKSTEEPPEARLSPICIDNITKPTNRSIKSPMNTYPELKIVVTKIIPHEMVTSSSTMENASRQRPRRNHHRKQHENT